jgi:Zn-dependent protease with chaperone function
VSHDDTPTPRPFTVDRRAWQRSSEADTAETSPASEDESDVSSRPRDELGPPERRLYELYANDADEADAQPVAPPPPTNRTLSERLAGRRQLGLPPAARFWSPEDEQRPALDPEQGEGNAADSSTSDARRRRAEPTPWEQIAGPADRASFFEEQARHRRQTWRLTAVSTLAVMLAGLPLSLVVTPIIFLAVLLVTKGISLSVPLPAAVPAFFNAVAWSIGAIFTWMDASDRGQMSWSITGAALLGTISMLLPGILAMLGLWHLLRRLFSGAGVGGLVIGLGAREPDQTDLEERQLVNVVEEMAIAAGLPAPKVMLLDGQIANAAVVGSSPADAVVVVSRRLLDEMDRDETQGILAHQIGTIGNGDLGVALSLVTVFRTFGLVNTLLDAPISSSARQTLRRLWDVLHDQSGGDAARRAAEVARLLGSRVSMMEMEDVDIVLGNDESKRRDLQGIGGILMRVRVWALFPIWAAAGLAKTALMVMTFALLSPLLAWTWRTRRFLADATAVQLTRNPDGIARGLQGLLSRGGGIRGGAWADHLFVVGGGVTQRAREHEERLVTGLRDEVERESEGTSGVDRVAARLRAGDRYRQRLLAEEEETASFDEPEIGQFSWISAHPPLPSRLKRLQAMGAHVSEAVFASPTKPKHTALMWLVVSPLFALVAVLLGVVVVLSTGLVVVFMMVPMGVVYLVFKTLF